jgi:hypothetical protein
LPNSNNKFAAGIILATALLARGQPARDPNVVLEQARARLQAMAGSLEKYVCVETVDRSYYQRLVPRDAPPQPQPEPACRQPDAGNAAARDPLQLASTDRVRLEVTVAQGHELHSWPGATRFDARNVDELIRQGPVSTGSFGAYLDSIFGRPGAVFHYIGEPTAEGKTAFEYGYRVPREASRFEIKVGESWLPTAYEGEFRIDPQSLELERLTVRTDDLPAGAPFCEAASTLDYRRIHIGDSDLPLPSRSQLEIVLKNGPETRNVTTFSNCREYRAESEIVFDESSGAGSAAMQSGARGRVTLPLGLPVTLALDGPIDTATAASGDPVAAKVVKPVRRPGSAEALIPAGAMVRGRIRRLEHHLLPRPYFLVRLAFNRVEVRGVVSPFEARSEAGAELTRELGANSEMRDTGIWFWGVGTFLFPSNQSSIVVPAGFESRWFTLATGR